jgi:phospholipase C
MNTKKRIEKPTAKPKAVTKPAKPKARTQGSRPKRSAKSAIAYTAVSPDPDVQNLDKIEHIVVLMMENRSFDQMLGYLKLEKSRSDVNGLTAGLSNTYNEKRYEIYLQTNTKLRSDQDPCHDGGCVAEQLDNNNGGFVKNYAETHEGDPDVGLVMGYFNETALPTHDHIAEEFAVCDQWYASVPGATWPNRLYAVAGRAAGSKDNPSGLPRYYLSSFVRHLDAKGVSWKWYAYPLWNPFGGILTTLQMTDDKYNASDAGNYAYCDPDFFEDAANGRLAAVTWIDPNFGYPMHGAYENDDHPPADVVAGQELALKVYHAITQGPLWEKSLLLIVYDEHGGFYDHVHPIRAPDDDPNFRQYGVRVPALIVSPWINRAYVSHDCYDHTSIIKTILLRFCRTGNSIPGMGARVNAANHLGGLLSLSQARAAPSLASHQAVVDRIAEWHAAEVRARFQTSGVRGEAPPELTEFQKGLVAAAASFAAREKRRTRPKTRRATKKRKGARPPGLQR